MKRLVLSAAIGAFSVALLCGCGRSASKMTSADMKAFNGATPELTQSWAAAQAAAGTNDYLFAILTLRSILRQNLSAAQLEAVQNAIQTYDAKLMKAADRGDATAQKTLETLRSPSTMLGR